MLVDESVEYLLIMLLHVIWNFAYDLAHAPISVAELQLDPEPPKSSEDAEMDVDDDLQRPENSVPDENQQDSSNHRPVGAAQSVSMSDCEVSKRVDSIKKLLVVRTKDYGIPQLERLYARIMKGIFDTKSRVKLEDLKASILEFLLEFAKDQSRF